MDEEVITARITKGNLKNKIEKFRRLKSERRVFPFTCNTEFCAYKNKQLSRLEVRVMDKEVREGLPIGTRFGMCLNCETFYYLVPTIYEVEKPRNSNKIYAQEEVKSKRPKREYDVE